MSTVVQGILLAVIGVLLFGLIIFIHEFGHFFTAKLSHVCVNEFSIGMGPRRNAVFPAAFAHRRLLRHGG